ncbi:hypothetical protein [Caballeronia grimmiae]|uniref:Pyridoxamine 5'-phosphate oxidase n=1 Tax=Caballeronia grimmiae TaxID=1071679 RepID=A0A069NFQ3_9BURK|nr:hypothetical protein [Caballeronia grimmiae]KDR27213.1 pyridoxamine 5'-phosphate oxidase [Caballeronia grimmiae]
MSDLTLDDLATRMAEIDFAMLSTRSLNGKIAARPMSNNRDVKFQFCHRSAASAPAASGRGGLSLLLGSSALKRAFFEQISCLVAGTIFSFSCVSASASARFARHVHEPSNGVPVASRIESRHSMPMTDASIR